MRTNLFLSVLGLFIVVATACGSTNGGDSHAGIKHVDMKSSLNAANAPYDLQFIDTMIAHHQGVIEMAKSAQAKALRSEIETLAQKIIVEQEKKIAHMTQWREKRIWT